MKKENIFLFLLFASLMISCSLEELVKLAEDEFENDIDLIIGSWKPIKMLDKTGTIEITTYNDCKQKSLFTFEENQDLILLDFSEINGICVQNLSFDRGTWWMIDYDGKFAMQSQYYDENLKRNVTYDYVFHVTFPTANTVTVVFENFENTYLYSRIE